MGIFNNLFTFSFHFVMLNEMKHLLRRAMGYLSVPEDLSLAQGDKWGYLTNWL
jgi:hypothetical protein